LPEIIADAKGVGPGAKSVDAVFRTMLHKLGHEMFILRDAPLDAVERAGGRLIAEGIRRVRQEEVHIAAGYDGEYGTVQIFTPRERETADNQPMLF
jgi:PHP family Zn ribbon phosphoesterase